MTRFMESRFSVGGHSEAYDANYESVFGKKLDPGACRKCDGSGRIVGHECMACEGTGNLAYGTDRDEGK